MSFLHHNYHPGNAPQHPKNEFRTEPLPDSFTLYTYTLLPLPHKINNLAFPGVMLKFQPVLSNRWWQALLCVNRERLYIRTTRSLPSNSYALGPLPCPI